MRHTPASLLYRDRGGWQPRYRVLCNWDGKQINLIRTFVLFATDPDHQNSPPFRQSGVVCHLPITSSCG